MLKVLILSLLAITLNACGSDESLRSSQLKGHAEHLAEEDAPYNQFKQKSVHNAYQRKESIEEMVNTYGLRSIELDIHTSKLFRPGLGHDWYVYHEWFDLGSKVDTLSEGLERLAAVSRNNEDPISLFVDLKSKFDSSEHRFEDLDELLQSTLGDKLFRPRDLTARCPGAEWLSDAVRLCGWPLRSELHGRILVILTGSAAYPYAPNPSIALDRMAFVAPTIEKGEELGIHSHAIIFNLNKKTVFETDLSEILFNQGKVLRTWDVNSSADWQKALNKPIAHIATNKN
ncbi:MAG: hypothetical protein EOP07_20125 [Proteobacteria bacterium]|nr:MAG: hypothetical protein EOP07_20125 [Pseudomonadota bacterium]